MRLSGEVYQDLLSGLLAEGQTVLTRVRGSSMTPAVPDGATARLEPLGRQPVRGGEVVITRTPHGLLCHRVLTARRDQRVETWGDTCHAPDEPVPAQEVLGRLVALEVEGQWRTLAPRPAWHMRGRWLKYRLRKLLGLIDDRNAASCTAAPDDEEGGV